MEVFLKHQEKKNQLMIQKTDSIIFNSTGSMINKNEKLFKFWNLEKKENKAELMLYGDIKDYSSWTEEEISAVDVIRELKSLDVDEIIIHINSNGGGATSAVAIANTLKQHKAKITCYIDGIVASAATIITSACDIVKMPNNAIFMIHNPWTIVMGDSKELNKKAEVLEKIKDTIISTYVNKTGLEENILSELMDNESWMTSEEAKKYGFVDEIIEDTDLEIVENKVLSHGLVFNMVNIDKFNIKNKGVGVNVENISNLSNENIKNEGDKKMTKEEIKEKFPEIYDSIFNDGVEKGVKNERIRIKEIEELGISGEIVDKAKFEEIKNAKELAFEVIKLQKEQNQIEKESKIEKIKNIKEENKPLNSAINTQIVDKDKEEADKYLALFNKGGK